MPNLLEQIVADKRVEVAAKRRARPLEQLRESAGKRPPPLPFVPSLCAVPIGLIAEVKRRSPSAGVIRDPFDPMAIACAYQRSGVQAISVLMDEKYFGGGEAQFQAVREAVDLPLLYKEFVVDEWQVWHAAALGASAILLIAAVLSVDELRALMRACQEARLEVLLEVHDEAEMRVAVGVGELCIGINNRDLKNFKTSLDTTFQLKPLAPSGCSVVSESGIKTAADVQRLRTAGVRAVLVGEGLLRSRDLETAVRSLMSG